MPPPPPPPQWRRCREACWLTQWYLNKYRILHKGLSFTRQIYLDFLICKMGIRMLALSVLWIVGHEMAVSQHLSFGESASHGMG